jgi:hypothetical protein
MNLPQLENKPYKTNFVHLFIDWLDRLPLPAWVSLLILFPVVGVVQHLVAYGRGFLSPGEFNFDLGTAGYWLLSGPLLFIWAIKGSRQAWVDIQLLVSPDEAEHFARMYYEFYNVPKWGGTVALLIGGLTGLWMGFADKAVAPAVDYAFAELRLSSWVIGSAFIILTIYQLIRQLNIIRNLYTRVAKVDIFNPQLLYGFPRYTATFGVAMFFYIYLAPMILDPTAFASNASFAAPVMLVPLILAMFYLPLAGMHNRLLNEKEALRAEVGGRIRTILRDIHRAAFDKKDFENTNSMIAVHSVLLKEKETIEDLSTWPWRPSTLNGLLSAILLPIVLTILRDVISGWLGL